MRTEVIFLKSPEVILDSSSASLGESSPEEAGVVDWAREMVERRSIAKRVFIGVIRRAWSEKESEVVAPDGGVCTQSSISNLQSEI
jgi:hypothetical protein